MKTAALAFLLVWSSAVFAQSAPRPPCGDPPQPSYAELGQQPNLQVWGKTSLAAWTPPPCTGWTGAGDLLVALSGAFSHAGGADELLNRFGAVSTLRGIQYWSVTDKAWRVLITDAAALGGPGSKDRRPDFAASEMKSGQELYFAQHDSRSTGEVVYRMRVREARADHVILELENMTPVRAFIITLFKPGDMKFLYFLHRRAGGTWGIYALLAANSSRAEGNEASFINRAAAFYRHFIGVAPEGSPPLAR